MSIRINDSTIHLYSFACSSHNDTGVGIVSVYLYSGFVRASLLDKRIGSTLSFYII